MTTFSEVAQISIKAWFPDYPTLIFEYDATADLQITLYDCDNDLILVKLSDATEIAELSTTWANIRPLVMVPDYQDQSPFVSNFVGITQMALYRWTWRIKVILICWKASSQHKHVKETI